MGNLNPMYRITSFHWIMEGFSNQLCNILRFDEVETLTPCLGLVFSMLFIYKQHKFIITALIMQIKAAVSAIRNIHGLPSDPGTQRDMTVVDLFDFLQSFFGFQVFSKGFRY